VLLNALDAMRARKEAEEQVLEVSTEMEGDTIAVSVKDSGIGMSEEVYRHAFEPFFSTKEKGKGTGLGLYISRDLMQEIGGSITLEPNRPRGTRVILRVPGNPSRNITETKGQAMPPGAGEAES
jgi:signal transduction histidine kinase